MRTRAPPVCRCGESEERKVSCTQGLIRRLIIDVTSRGKLPTIWMRNPSSNLSREGLWKYHVELIHHRPLSSRPMRQDGDKRHARESEPTAALLLAGSIRCRQWWGPTTSTWSRTGPSCACFFWKGHSRKTLLTTSSPKLEPFGKATVRQLSRARCVVVLVDVGFFVLLSMKLHCSIVTIAWRWCFG